MHISEEIFIKAVTSSGFPRPSHDQYNIFIRCLRPSQIGTLTEAAMALAQFLHESGGLIYKEEISHKDNPNANDYRHDDDHQGCRYYGRGYIQLTWSYNYQAASQALFGDDRLWRHPEIVADNEGVAWGVSFWFWDTNVHPREGVRRGHFGDSTLAINGGIEHEGLANPRSAARWRIYQNVFTQFGCTGQPLY